MFPGYTQDGAHNYAPLEAMRGSCEMAIGIGNDYYVDLYSALQEADYTDWPDDEFFDVLAQSTIDKYGLQYVPCEDVRDHVITYDNMILALDDLLAVKGC